MRLLVIAILAAAVAPAGAEPKDRFKLLSLAEQARAAAAIEASFPARWRPKVKVDQAGFVSELVVTVAKPITDGDAVARVTELVGDHAAAFGVLDPKALHGQREHADVHVGEGARWTGNIMAHHEARLLRVYGHLWPIETPRPAEVDRAKLLDRYLGLKGTRPSKCNCGRDDEIVLGLDSFAVDAGIALICRDGVLRPRPAIALRAELGGGTAPGLEGMPRLLDAVTRERIDDDFVMPPYGEGEPTSGDVDAVQAFATNRCFYR